MDGEKGKDKTKQIIFQNILNYETDNVTFFLQVTISPNTSMHAI